MLDGIDGDGEGVGKEIEYGLYNFNISKYFFVYVEIFDMIKIIVV